MEGNSLITCLPNGKWQDAPRCINAESKVPLIIPIGTGVGSFVVILVVLIGCIKRKRLQRFWLNKRRPIRLKRAQKNSEHAVFIFYISSDESFVLDTLLNLFQNDRTCGGFEKIFTFTSDLIFQICFICCTNKRLLSLSMATFRNWPKNLGPDNEHIF